MQRHYSKYNSERNIARSIAQSKRSKWDKLDGTFTKASVFKLCSLKLLNCAQVADRSPTSELKHLFRPSGKVVHRVILGLPSPRRCWSHLYRSFAL